MSDRLSDSRLHKLLQEQGHVPSFTPAKERKPRSREESLLQISLIRWWHHQCRVFGVPEILLASCPNGGGRSGPIVGSILKAEGLRAGFPDLGLYVRRVKTEHVPESIARKEPSYERIVSDYGALFLELKRRDGVVSPEQETFHIRLREQGYKVVVCRTLQDAINQITAYLTT